MGEISGKHALVEQLHQEGVEYIFGNPGTTELPLMDVLAQRDDLRYILSLHEGVALAMAPGYAEASGKIGVTNFHVAPGLGNALGLVYTAYMGRTPLLVTAGQQDRRMQLVQLGASACLGAAATGDATNGRPAEGHVRGWALVWLQSSSKAASRWRRASAAVKLARLRHRRPQRLHQIATWRSQEVGCGGYAQRIRGIGSWQQAARVGREAGRGPRGGRLCTPPAPRLPGLTQRMLRRADSTTSLVSPSWTRRRING